MADKPIGELVEATSITPTDLLVMQQDNTAKKITGQTLINFLTAIADGHGGIRSVEKVSTSVLVDKYRITLADLTTFDFTVTNGRAITSVSQTSESGLSRTYTIAFNDGSKETFEVRDGAKGDTGQAWYVWIKYASQEPTDESHSIGNLPDDWIGIYNGPLEDAPDDWTMYSWFCIKGETGDTGAPAVLNSSVTDYQSSDSGTIIPSGIWTTTIPNVAQGKYLWSRTTITFNTGAPAVSYSVSRIGRDGTGSVSSVANVSPDANGNVPLTAEDVGALPVSGGTMGGAVNMDGHRLRGLSLPETEDEAATLGYTNTQITNRVIYSGGKNLFRNLRQTEAPLADGVTYTPLSNGRFSLSGTAASTAVVGLYPVYPAASDTNIGSFETILTLKAGQTVYTNGLQVIGRRVSDGTVIYFGNYNISDANTQGTYTATEDIEVVQFCAFARAGETYSADTIWEPIFSLAPMDVYEPYYEGLAEVPKKLSMELLWKNASGSSAFAAQTIPLSLKSTDVIAVDTPAGLTFAFVGKDTRISYLSSGVSSSGATFLELLQRSFTSDTTGVTFRDARYAYLSAGTEINPKTQNTGAIPRGIYRLKGVIA